MMAMILGTTKLTRDQPGVMRGVLQREVGPQLAVTLDQLSKVDDQWSARLTIGRDHCQVLLFPPQIAGMFDATEDRPKEWYGIITIEGYQWQATIEHATGVLELRDWDKVREAARERRIAARAVEKAEDKARREKVA